MPVQVIILRRMRVMENMPLPLFWGVCFLFSFSSSCENLLSCSFLTYQLYSFVFSWLCECVCVCVCLCVPWTFSRVSDMLPNVAKFFSHLRKQDLYPLGWYYGSGQYISMVLSAKESHCAYIHVCTWYIYVFRVQCDRHVNRQPISHHLCSATS